MINREISEFPIMYMFTGNLGKIALGWGAHTTVGKECQELGLKNVLITTTGLKGTGIVDEIVSILNYHDVATTVFDGVTSNPKDYEVFEGLKIFRDAKCDGVVSVGGGSSHDCGKAIRAIDANDVKDVADVFVIPGDASTRKPVSKPQIAVNTTAGTGAENTSGGVVTNTHAPGNVRVKGGVSAPRVACTVSITDPLLVRLQPERVAAGTAFDAFTHAFEMYVSRIHSQLSIAIALGAIKLVAQSIREFVYNRGNHQACENMCWASSMAGAVGLSTGGGQGIVHGMGHALSGNYETHHGMANALVALAGERYNLPACPDRFAEMARAMDIDTTGLSDMEAAEKWIEEVERMLKDLKITPGHLKEQVGLEKAKIPALVDTHVAWGVKRSNPRVYVRDECISLFESLL